MLTYEQLKFLVGEMTKIDGNQYISPDDAANFDPFMNDRLQAFSLETLCLYSDTVVFTPDNDSASPVFNYRKTSSSAFSKPMAYIDQMYFNGAFMKNPMGQPGPWTFDELSAFNSNYLGAARGAAASDTTIWVPLPPTSIRLYKQPVAGATGYATGWTLHSTMATDADVLDIPAEYHRAVAAYCAAHLIEPYAGDKTIEKMGRFDQEAANQMVKLRENAEMMLGRLQQRGRQLSYVMSSAPPQQGGEQ